MASRVNTGDINAIQFVMQKLTTVERDVEILKANQSPGQQSYNQPVSVANYSHSHRLSQILNLSKLAGTLLTYSDEVLSVDEANIDHGSIAGLGDDDHTQYAQIAAAETITGVWSFGAVQINFANGTTYKIQADGDAYFKILNLLEYQWVGSQINQVLANSDSAGPLWNFQGYLSGTTKFRDFFIYDGKEVLIVHVDGSHKLFKVFGTGRFGDGGATNYAQFSTTGKLSLHGSATLTGNILHDGTGGDDERIRLPYLTGVPASADNGSIWMEADGLHGYLAAAERNLSRPHCLDSYLDIKTRQSVWDIHGGIESISTANALDSVPTDITDTIGLGKIIVVINAGGDVTGTITVTGTTVDRDTGAETGADTDTLTVDTLTTDNSGTDAGGNVTYAFINAYITTKWFKGAVTLSTTNLTLTDVDIYQCSFEQFNDLPNVMIDTIDTNQLANNTAANIYWHLYSVKPSGDKVTLAKEVSMELTAADVAANKHYRLRRGNLAISIDGTTEGFFVQCYPEPLASLYWEDINLKIWYY